MMARGPEEKGDLNSLTFPVAFKIMGRPYWAFSTTIKFLQAVQLYRFFREAQKAHGKSQ